MNCTCCTAKLHSIYVWDCIQAVNKNERKTRGPFPKRNKTKDLESYDTTAFVLRAASDEVSEQTVATGGRHHTCHRTPNISVGNYSQQHCFPCTAGRKTGLAHLNMRGNWQRASIFECKQCTGCFTPDTIYNPVNVNMIFQQTHIKPCIQYGTARRYRGNVLQEVYGEKHCMSLHWVTEAESCERKVCQSFSIQDP